MKIAVIGGGAAGMMASCAAAPGNQVDLYEKNEKLGKKLYITGKGRCNVTNLVDTTEFLTNVVSNRRFLYSAINMFGTQDAYQFFVDNGIELKIERGKRVFPFSDKASDITKALVRQLNVNNVNVVLNCKVLNLIADNDRLTIVTSSGKNAYDKVIIACGGMSYPMTGSTGDGYIFARSQGHSIVEPRAGLVGIDIKCNCLSQLMGLSLKNVQLKILQGNKIVYQEFGEMLFTDSGISGPIVLSASSNINRLDLSQLTASIDLKPALNDETLNARLLNDFGKFINKQLKNSLDELLPKSLIDVVISQSAISPNIACNSITKTQRKSLVDTIKNLSFPIIKLGGLDKAIITCGGVAVDQINAKTMESKICPNLYFAGEVIDVDGLTGGFNIQIALSTGYLAGISAAKSTNQPTNQL